MPIAAEALQLQDSNSKLKLNLFNDGTLSNTSNAFALPGGRLSFAGDFVGKCTHFFVLFKSLDSTKDW